MSWRNTDHRPRSAPDPWHAGLLARIGRRLLIVFVLTVVAIRWLDIDVERVLPLQDCRVTWVIDGDTVTLTCASGREIRARLVGFDAPEVYSPDCDAEKRVGNAATEALRAAIAAANKIDLRRVGWDHYGRTLVRMTLDGRNVAETMVAAGLARKDGWGEEEGWCE